MATTYSPCDCVAECRWQMALSFAFYMGNCNRLVLASLPSLSGTFADDCGGVCNWALSVEI